MSPKALTPEISVSAQINPTDLEAISAAGFRSVICNRPDGEGADQPGFNEIKAAAEALGLQVAYIPVVGGQLSQRQVDEFQTALRDLPGPVLAYCRSGTRSATLWSLAQRGTMAPADIVTAAANAGYDMRPIFGTAP